MKQSIIRHSRCLLLLLCLLATTACKKDVTLPQDDSTKALTINATLDGKAIAAPTRGYGGDVDIAAKGFTVTGYLMPESYSADKMKTALPNVFDKSQPGGIGVMNITTPDTDGKFTIPLPALELSTADDTRFLSVMAWTQGDTDATFGITAHTKKETKGEAFIDINLQSPEFKQGDIVAAHVVDHKNDYVLSAIDLDFNHILSKLSFVLKNSTSSSLEVTDVKIITAQDAIYSKAKFTFNASDSIGAYSNYSEYYPQKSYTPTEFQTPTIPTSQTVALGQLLLLPQAVKAGYMSIQVSYSVDGGTVNTRTLPLDARMLESGDNYIHTLEVSGTSIGIINVSIGGWVEVPTNTLPMLPGPCADVVLQLDGTNAPYQHTDGKLYWLDRSGYNNHCEIISNDPQNPITYNATKKGYTFTTAQGHIKVPNLGTFEQDMYCEFIGQSNRGNFASATAIDFTATAGKGADARLAFDYTNSIVAFHTAKDKYAKAQLAYDGLNFGNRAYYACRQTYLKQMTIRRNNRLYSDAFIGRSNSTVAPIELNNGIIGGENWNGEVNFMRISRAVPNSLEKAEAECSALMGVYNITEDVTFGGTYLPPVTSGLILCVDGRQPPQGDTWIDQSVSKNNLKQTKTIADATATLPNLNTPTNGNKAVNFNNHIFALTKDFVNKLDNLTIEVVVKPNNLNHNCLVDLSNVKLTNMYVQKNPSINIAIPNESNEVQFAAINYFHKQKIPNSLVQVTTSKRSKFTFTRDAPLFVRAEGQPALNKYMKTWVNGTLKADEVLIPLYSGLYDLRALKTSSFFGGTLQAPKSEYYFDSYFNGEVCAIRIYDRVLTDDEIKRNYDSDNTEFGPF